jgi:hypothetical protein
VVPHRRMIPVPTGLRVAAQGIVDRLAPVRIHLKGERLAVIWLLRVVGPAVMGDHVREERVRTGREVRWVRKGEDVFDLGQGKSLSLSEVGIEQMLMKPF